MSLRTYKKILKEREADLQPENGSESEDDSIVAHTNRAPMNVFALLGGEDEDNDSAGSAPEQDHEDEPPRPVSPSPSPAPKGKKKRKGKKKGGATADEPSTEQGAEDDDFDTQIRELSGINAQDAGGEEESRDERGGGGVPNLLSVQRNYLSAEHEMRRVFGSRTIEDAGSNAHAPRGQRRGQPRHLRKFWLAQPRPTWPPWTQPGLRMELLEKKGGNQYFTFSHNKSYQEVQMKFFAAVESMDPNMIMGLLNRHPYHIDSLLQLAEICSMQGDQQLAVELVERVLYVSECNFNIQFKPALGTCKLDYRRFENRAFFLALFRYIGMLGQKGCWRTALEYNKFLLSLDDTDPVGSLLMIDLYALRAREYAWLVNLYEEWEPQRHLSLLPNFAFSIALAHMHLESQARATDDAETGVLQGSDAKSNQLLQKALLLFPMILLPLADKAGIDLPPAVFSSTYFERQTQADAQTEGQLSVLSLVQLYVERCSSVWKEPQVGPWLRANVSAALSAIKADPASAEVATQQREAAYEGPGSRSVHRHLIISGYRDPISLLPRYVREEPLRTYDPLSPPDGVSPYTPPDRATDGSAQAAISLFLRSLFPSFTVEEGRELVEQGQANLDLGNIGNVINMNTLREMLNNFQLGGGEPDGQEDHE